MSAAEPKVREISAQDRQKLDELLGEFHRTWEAGRLDHALAELPPDLPYRLAAVTGLAAIDLEMRWQHGDPARVEEYLQKYPELGTAENVSIELLLAEFFAQERYESAPDLNAFLARFPQQSDDLRRLIALARSPRLSGIRSSRSSGSSSGHSQHSEDGPNLPEQFDRYRIQKKLGHGGMGTVYLAYDTRLERKVALKVPRFAPGSNHENLERFYREAKATATITHPNLCPLYDVGEINGTPYLTMAYIEGWPLSKFIRPDKLLPQFGVATVVRIVAQAIEEAHKRGVIHRDLKPGNIMINKRGEPIVMDFGLARWVNADKEDVRLTRSGAILGAPVYMSPEQVYGDVDAMGPGCDVYSLGVILYELLTGRLPFDGPTTAVLAKTLIQPPKPPSAYRPDVDPRLEAICLKAMAKKISERYASMAELAAPLTEYIRAERQAQTLTSLSTTKLPGNGTSGPMAETLSGDKSTSSVVRKKPKTSKVSLHAMQTNVNDEATEVLAPEDVSVPSLPEVEFVKPKRTNVLLWLGLAGAGAFAALLFVGLLGWLLWPPSSRTTTPAAPENVGSLQIVLSEMPDDVEVRLAGKVIERDKLAKPLTLEPGEYRVEVKSAKFVPWSQTVRVEQGNNPRLDVTLRPKEPVAVVPPELKEPKPGVLFDGPGGAIKSVACSADGSLVLSGSEDFLLRLIDVGTREVKQQFREHRLPVTSVALSMDGTRALSGGGDGLVIVWDVRTGLAIHRMEGHKDWVRTVAISPDGKWGLSGGDDKTVRLWNLDTGVERKEAPMSHTGTVWSVAFSRDGKSAASGSEDHTICLWNLATQTQTKQLTGHLKDVRSVTFLPDGRVLSGSDDRTLRLWDATSGSVLKEFSGHAGMVRGVAVSSDGHRAVSGSYSEGDGTGRDNTVRLWDLDKGTLLYALGSVPKGNNSVAFTPNDRWVISGGEDGAIRVWDSRVQWPGTLPPAPAPDVRNLEVRRFGAKHDVERIAISKDGRFALSAGKDGTVRYWDLGQGRELRTIDAHKGRVHFVAFSPDDRLALSCGVDKVACLWNLETGNLVKKFVGHTGEVWGALFTPDGTRVVTCGGDNDNTARMWDATTDKTVVNEPLKIFKGHTKGINAIALSPDGTRLLTAGWDATLRVWDVEKAEELHSFKEPSGRFASAAFFGDGRRAVASFGPKVKLYDVNAFKELRSVDDGRKDSVWIVATSPGGHRMLSAGSSGIINLWDADGGKLLHSYTGHTKSVPAVAFTPDGTRILSGSADFTLRLWDLPRNLFDPPPLPTSQETKETKLLQAPTTQMRNYTEQVSFTADGKRALWCGDDKMVHVWDLDAGKELLKFDKHTNGVRSFALLSDGKRVLSASYDKTVRLWELNTGKEIRRFTNHTERVQCVAVTPDGKLAVSAGDDKVLRLWNVDDAHELKKMAGHEKTIFAVAVTPDGREAISGALDKTIRRWNLETGTEIAKWTAPHDVHTVAVSPDGRRVLSGGKDKKVSLWDRESGELLASFVGPTDNVTCVRFSPDGRWALAGSGDKAMRLWNIETGQEMARSTAQKTGLKGVAFSPDARFALSGSADSSVHLWTLPDYTAPIPVGLLKSYPTNDKLDRVAISPDGQWALSAGYDNKVRLWDVERGEESKVYDWHTGPVHYVSFSPDGKQAASASQDKTAVVWDIASGNLVRRIEGHKAAVWDVAFSPDGTRLLTCSDDNTAIIWNLQTGAAEQTFTGHTKRINGAVWLPDGSRIVTASLDKTAQLWDVKTGKPLKHYSGHSEGVATLAVSPNACYLVTGSYDKSVRLWDLETEKCLHIFDGHTAGVWNVAFSPDGRRVLSSGSDKTMRLWDVESRRLLHTYSGSPGGVTGVAFHPDGRRALSSSMSGTMDKATEKTLRLWGLPVY